MQGVLPEALTNTAVPCRSAPSRKPRSDYLHIRGLSLAIGWLRCCKEEKRISRAYAFGRLSEVGPRLAVRPLCWAQAVSRETKATSPV